MGTEDNRRPTPLPSLSAGRGDVGGATQSFAPRCHQIDSEQILGGATEVLINHHGAIYRLKLTSLGKLILTK